MDYDVYAQHVLSSGTVDPAWLADGSALCKAANDQDSPVIVGDGAGGAIIAWYDFRGDGADIYAQRMYGSGAVAGVTPLPAATRLAMLSPHPNPGVGGPVAIGFDLPSDGLVSAELFDVAGHRVRTLAMDRRFAAGRGTLEWDGRDDAGARVPAAVYFVRVRVGNQSEARPLVLIR